MVIFKGRVGVWKWENYTGIALICSRAEWKNNKGMDEIKGEASFMRETTYK